MCGFVNKSFEPEKKVKIFGKIVVINRFCGFYNLSNILEQWFIHAYLSYLCVCMCMYMEHGKVRYIDFA